MPRRRLFSSRQRDLIEKSAPVVTPRRLSRAMNGPAKRSGNPSAPGTAPSWIIAPLGPSRSSSIPAMVGPTAASARQPRSEAHAVDSLVGVVSKRNHVSISGEVLPSAGRETGHSGRATAAESPSTRASRTPGIPCRHESASQDCRTRSRARSSRRACTSQSPACASARFDRRHLHAAEYRRTGVGRRRKIVHDQRVLGRVVTPGDAVAAQRAAPLLDAELVDVRVERHGDRRRRSA